MKTCPNCGTRYTDDTLSFCLSDGGRLAGDDAASAMTVVIGETETFVRPELRHGVQTPPQAPSRSRTGLAVALTAAGMLILFGIVAIVGFVIWKNYDSSGGRPQNGSDNRLSSNSGNPSPNPTVKTTQTPAVASPQPTVAKTPEPPKRAVYPATQRVKLARGAFSAPFSGEINPGDERSFVLSCRAGQSLSASLSGGSCVTFSGGGTSISRSTVAGDNYVTVTNICPAVARFSGQVRIF